jgi:hypothetical protein
MATAEEFVYKNVGPFNRSAAFLKWFFSMRRQGRCHTSQCMSRTCFVRHVPISRDHSVLAEAYNLKQGNKRIDQALQVCEVRLRQEMREAGCWLVLVST